MAGTPWLCWGSPWRGLWAFTSLEQNTWLSNLLRKRLFGLMVSGVFATASWQDSGNRRRRLATPCRTENKEMEREKKPGCRYDLQRHTPPVTYFLHKIPLKVSRTSQKRLWRIFHFEAIAKSLCTCPPLQEQLAWWCIADGNVWVTAEHSTSCWWAVHPSQRTGSQARVRKWWLTGQNWSSPTVVCSLWTTAWEKKIKRGIHLSVPLPP